MGQLVWKVGLVAFGSLAVGKTEDVFTLSAACIEANSQGGSVVISLRLISLCPAAKLFSVFNNSVLPCSYDG